MQGHHPEGSDAPPVSLSVSRSRSGVVLAAARVAMVLLFGLWAWIDPHHPFHAGPITGPLFATYLLFACVLLGIAWRSWWYEYRLARPSFVVDVVIFLAGLYVTEAVTLDFFTPFMALFAFLMLTSVTRWQPRSILYVAAALAICFLLAGLLVALSGFHVELARFVRRFSYLVLLSAMLSWLAFNRATIHAPRYLRLPEGRRGFPLEGALDYAIAAYGAGHGGIVWLGEGESRPRLHAVGLADESLSQTRALPLDPLPMLFDMHRHRALALIDGQRLSASGATFAGLVAALGIGEGLSIPIESRTGRGQVVLGGISHPCSDDLFIAPGVAREIGAAIDDEETEALAREVAMSRLRSQIATDLHDSVAQTLAGARFRLAALRARLGASPEATIEIDGAAAVIAAEQDHVRTIIEQLRRGEVLPGRRDLRQEVVAIAEQLAEQWLLTIEVDEGSDRLILPTALIFEVQQIIREAVANATRHGQARKVTIGVGMASETRISLTISDDGTGFPAGDVRPRSIATRVASLGGTLALSSETGGTLLAIEIPGASV